MKRRPVRCGLCVIVCGKYPCPRAFVVVERVAHHGKLSDFPRILWTDLFHHFLLILASSKIERRKDAQSHKLETEGND